MKKLSFTLCKLFENLRADKHTSSDKFEILWNSITGSKENPIANDVENNVDSNTKNNKLLLIYKVSFMYVHKLQ